MAKPCPLGSTSVAVTAFALLAASAWGCSRRATPPVVTPWVSDTPRAAPVSIGPLVGTLPPLEAATPQVDLAVPGHAPAVVSVPVGTTERRPIVVVAHGNFDRAEWQCRTWRSILGNR